MRNPIVRSALAAAVLVIAAVSLVVLDRSATPAYALADLPAAFDRAHVIHVEGWQYFPRLRLDDGTPSPPVHVHSWIDLENGRLRQTQVAVTQTGRLSLNSTPDVNTTITVTEAVCDGPYLMTLDHTARTATFTRSSDYYRRWTTYRQSQALWGQLCGQPAQLEHFVRTGRENIDGSPYDLWQLDAAGGMGGLGGGGAGGGVGSRRGSGSGAGPVDMAIPSLSLRFQLWISTKSGRLGRAQVLSRIGDGSWELEQEYHTIAYDVEIPARLFAAEPPSGYTVLNSKETAPVLELPRATVACGSLECDIAVSFTLGDGSVLVAWQSLDRKVGPSQEPLFANLTFGGPLPRLPIEIYSLKPAGVPDGAEYTGHHLGHTSKAGRFMEWALYVPSATPPANVKYLGYEALWRFNVAAPPKGRVGLRIPCGVPIQTPEDFDTWVRGALAELSDSATVPAEVTYQKVGDLARQIRTQVKP